MKSTKLHKKSFVVRNFKAVVGVLVLLLVLPVLLFARGNIVTLFSQAAPTPASIVVDVFKSQATLERPWIGLSQGGEQEFPGQLVSLVSSSEKVKALGTRYIRIDHVLEEPFSPTLEKRIKEITDSQALPFIALSYFPSDVAASNVGTPTNYGAWQQKVKNLIEKVSGRKNMNLSGVYYEVWNEPDGENFGAFDIGKGKDYFELYKQSVSGAQLATDVNPFKIGGPALADLRRCENGLLFVCQKFWLDEFLGLVSQNRARLDFISWHRYSTKLSDYKEDVNFINNLYYTKYSSLPPAEKIITEWGSVPQRSPIHNTVFDAAHLVAAARTFIGQVDLTTKFEIRDGPDSGGEGWGILTHSGQKKPTYAALELLNKLRFERILLSGEGTHVTGIASRDSGGVSVILVNYDSASSHTESVPVRIINLFPGRYRLTKYVVSSVYPLGYGQESIDTLPKGIFITQETMIPNSIVLYDLKLVGLLSQ